MPWNEVMSKWGSGTLKSGSGAPVKSQKQAVAVMLSEKKKAGSNPEYKASKNLRDAMSKKRKDSD